MCYPPMRHHNLVNVFYSPIFLQKFILKGKLVQNHLEKLRICPTMEKLNGNTHQGHTVSLGQS